MEVLILKDMLFDSLQIASKAVASKSTNPILECVLLIGMKDAGGEAVKMRCYDNEMGIETDSVSCEVIEPGAIALEAKMFLDIIKHLPESYVSIKVDSNRVTVIKCGKAEFKILGQDYDDFPNLPAVEKTKKYSLNAGVLKRMVRKTIFSVSTDEQRPTMTGELIEIKTNELRVVSVDSFRVSYCRYDTKEMESGAGEARVIIPSKTLSEICKILPGTEETEDTLNLYLEKNFALFECKGFVLVSRVINGDFINYESYFVNDYQTIVTVGRQLLISSIERASLVVNKDSLKKSPVKIEISGNLITISSNAETGTVIDEIEADADGADITIAFNPRYLLDALKAIEDDQVSLHFTTPLSPCILTGSVSDDSKYLVLPLRIYN